eukprot:gb/GECH01007510.1/.p1 GENE.gb/GECH01007510.1/~~gb/GECH01007510.1/.p1  ORF type:complete len:906 (+),score=222.25 gb/GECH01007510.1/:1-2718(+)
MIPTSLKTPQNDSEIEERLYVYLKYTADVFFPCALQWFSSSVAVATKDAVHIFDILTNERGIVEIDKYKTLDIGLQLPDDPKCYHDTLFHRFSSNSFRAVSWSPSLIFFHYQSLLCCVTSDFQVTVHRKPEKSYLFHWPMGIDVSSLWISHLKACNFSVNGGTPSHEIDVERDANIADFHLCYDMASVLCVSWSPILANNWLFLILGTKSGHLAFLRMFHSTMDFQVAGYVKTQHTAIQAIHTKQITKNYFILICGGFDGKISVKLIHVDDNGEFSVLDIHGSLLEDDCQPIRVIDSMIVRREPPVDNHAMADVANQKDDQEKKESQQEQEVDNNDENEGKSSNENNNQESSTLQSDLYICIGKNDTIHFLRVEDNDLYHRSFQPHKHFITGVQIDPYTRYVYSASVDGSARRWPLRQMENSALDIDFNAEEELIPPSKDHPLWGVVISPNASFIAFPREYPGDIEKRMEGGHKKKVKIVLYNILNDKSRLMQRIKEICESCGDEGFGQSMSDVLKAIELEFSDEDKEALINYAHQCYMASPQSVSSPNFLKFITFVLFKVKFTHLELQNKMNSILQNTILLLYEIYLCQTLLIFLQNAEQKENLSDEMKQQLLCMTDWLMIYQRLKRIYNAATELVPEEHAKLELAKNVYEAFGEELNVEQLLHEPFVTVQDVLDAQTSSSSTDDSSSLLQDHHASSESTPSNASNIANAAETSHDQSHRQETEPMTIGGEREPSNTEILTLEQEATKTTQAEFQKKEEEEKGTMEMDHDSTDKTSTNTNPDTTTTTTTNPNTSLNSNTTTVTAEGTIPSTADNSSRDNFSSDKASLKSIPIRDHCPFCNVGIPMNLGINGHCIKGHPYTRSSLTLRILKTYRVATCIGCGAKCEILHSQRMCPLCNMPFIKQF